MEDLRDIQGLDQVTAWPLAIGWWLVIAIAVVALGIFLWQLFKLYKYRRSWQYQSFLTLQNIEEDCKQEEHKMALQKLAIELRFIAMQYNEREKCAGLIGQPWLEWLHQHDPQKFPWQEKGVLLVKAQYMPELTDTDCAQIYNLIQAAKGWVRKC